MMWFRAARETQDPLNTLPRRVQAATRRDTSMLSAPEVKISYWVPARMRYLRLQGRTSPLVGSDGDGTPCSEMTACRSDTNKSRTPQSAGWLKRLPPAPASRGRSMPCGQLKKATFGFHELKRPCLPASSRSLFEQADVRCPWAGRTCDSTLEAILSAPAHSFTHGAVRGGVVTDLIYISQVRRSGQPDPSLRRVGLRHESALRLGGCIRSPRRGDGRRQRRYGHHVVCDRPRKHRGDYRCRLCWRAGG